MKLLLLLLFLLPLNVSAITAQSYIVVDIHGKVLLEKNADKVRPIASITKLFVAEQSVKLDQDEKIRVTTDDVKAGMMKSTPIVAEKYYTRRQLTELALVSSDNVAALALSRSAPPHTVRAEIVEGSGLNEKNQSTAREIATATRELYMTEVGRVSVQTKTEIGKRNSTNPLLNKQGWVFMLSKTGFINRSGGCLTVMLKVKDELVTIAILGADGTKKRWDDLIEIRKSLGDSNFYVPTIHKNKISKKTKVLKKHMSK